MEILKDLPTRNKDNFSKYCQRNKAHNVKEYLRVKGEIEDAATQAIVMESESLMLREFEREQKHKKTTKRKHSLHDSSDERSLKVRRADSCEDIVDSTSNDQLS